MCALKETVYSSVILIAAIAFADDAQAQSDLSDMGLAQCGSAKADSQKIRVGVRLDAPPFSSINPVEPFASERPQASVTGYTVELCEAFLNWAKLDGCYEPVEPDERWSALLDKKIDMLCGASTATIHVRNRFQTTLNTFITATALAVSGTASTSGIENPVIGYRAGTTADPEVTFERTEGENEPRIKEILKVHFPNLTEIEWKPLDDHFSVVEQLSKGGEKDGIDAVVADRAILAAIARQSDAGAAAIRIDPAALRLQPYAVIMPPPEERREGVPQELARMFDEFLVTERFQTGAAFAAYRERLLEVFGSDLDLSFIRLAEIQGEIPVGEPLLQNTSQ